MRLRGARFPIGMMAAITATLLSKVSKVKLKARMLLWRCAASLEGLDPKRIKWEVFTWGEKGVRILVV